MLVLGWTAKRHRCGCWHMMCFLCTRSQTCPCQTTWWSHPWACCPPSCSTPTWAPPCAPWRMSSQSRASADTWSSACRWAGFCVTKNKEKDFLCRFDVKREKSATFFVVRFEMLRNLEKKLSYGWDFLVSSPVFFCCWDTLSSLCTSELVSKWEKVLLQCFQLWERNFSSLPQTLK